MADPKTMQEFERLLEVVARLQGPEGCPWDRSQTEESVKTCILEETYELLDAIGGDDDQLKEELGDFLLQGVFIANIIAGRGGFPLHEALAAINDKLIRRHPHVFGEATAATPDEALANWEASKRKEKKDSWLEGIPASLPALIKAYRIIQKVAQVGFEWEDLDGVRAKLGEELAELDAAIDARRGAGGPVQSGNGKIAVDADAHLREEFGDVLFVMANLAKWLNIDPEAALQAANAKFLRRFAYIEGRLKERGQTLEAATLAEMDALWNEAKTREPDAPSGA